MDQFWINIVQSLKNKNAAASAPRDAAEKDARALWEMADGYKKKAYTPDVDANWQRFKQRMQEEPAVPVRRMNRPSPMRRMAAVAAVLLLALGALSVWRIYGPGQGTTIQVRAAGETVFHELPDGSRVWLNRNSELRYQDGWERRNRREVRLYGEAFFEVARMPEKPFKISTSRALVEVLGTQFNLRDYPAEPRAEVEVAEGKVAFGPPGGDALFLEKNMRAILETGKTPVLAAGEMPNAAIWRTGAIQCRGLTLGRINELLKRQELAALDFADARLARCTVTGPLEIKSLQASLELLCSAAGLELQPLPNNRFRVSGKPCT